jgi:DNA-binding transcriptional LysR family regulator
MRFVASATDAASVLGTSLPTVSRVLRSLERELGMRLIARITRGLSKTASGRLYYRRSQQILADIREAERAVRSTRRPRRASCA